MRNNQWNELGVCILENQGLGKVNYLGCLYIPVAAKHKIERKKIMMILHSFKSYINDILVYFMMTVLWYCSKIWVPFVIT